MSKAQAGGPKGAAPKAGATKAASPKVEAAKAPAAAPVAAKAAVPEAVAGVETADEHALLSFKRTLIGRVKSDKMNKTVVVEVVRSKMDPVYKKYVRVRKSYKAHDEENAYRIGDRVEIIEHRPLSKLKRWKVINLVERAVQE